MSSTSFLNQPFVYRDIFSSFFSAVCTEPTLTQQSEVSTTAVQMSTDRNEMKPIPSQQLNYWTSLLFPYRLCFKKFLHQHSGCLCCLQKVAKFPVRRHLGYQYPSISKYYSPRVWIALVSVKVAISSEKHAASVVRVNVFYHYAVDLRFLLELVYLHLVHLKLLHHVRSWTIHLQPSEPQISTRIDIYSHCLLTQSCSGISAPI